MLALLDVVARHHWISLTDLSRETGFTLNKVFRLLVALEEGGYVERRGDKAYRLGPKILSMTRRALEDSRLLRVAAPVLDELARQSGENVYLAVRFGAERLIIDRRESRHGGQPQSWPSSLQLPLNVGGLALCLLAHAPQAVRTKTLTGSLKGYTTYTLTDPHALEKALELVQRDGVRVQLHDHVVGEFSVAAPVLDVTGLADAALNIAGSTGQLSSRTEQRYVDLVQWGAASIADRLN